jgi:hypothetical protein
MAYGTEAAVLPGDRIAAAGVDHARLTYHYLDCGDIDSYASLLHDDIVLRRPGAATISGRDRVEHARARSPKQRHVIDRVFAAGDRIAAIGRVTDRTELEFVDIFTVSDNGLLIAQTTYFFTPPPGHR